jgi:Tol biopolymer transport system component
MTARSRNLPWFALWLALATCSCGSRPPPAGPPAASERIAIVASERGPHGARLVAIDEHGDRRFVVVQPALETARDTNPAVSPDGKWIVFVSSRGRSLAETSLWIAPLEAEATPVRLTAGPAIDSHPTWTPDGKAIVFASTREGGDFDLWRLAIDRGGAVGEAEQLTHGAGHEVTPTVAADGTIIYAAVTPLAPPEIESHLEELAPDGTVRRLTSGPADSSPALSPDGKTIAFARPQVHGKTIDSELWRMARGSDLATPIVDLPMTQESGPVWSRDGRFVFATSVLRGEESGVLFSSIVYVDLQDKVPRARMLEDHAGAVARLTPALASSSLDAAALHENPEYLPELARIMAAEIAKQSSR